jgi:hypothetical protein
LLRMAYRQNSWEDSPERRSSGTEKARVPASVGVTL